MTFQAHKPFTRAKKRAKTFSAGWEQIALNLHYMNLWNYLKGVLVSTCETEAGCFLTMRSWTPVGQKVQVREVLCRLASFWALDSSERGVIATVSSLNQLSFYSIIFLWGFATPGKKKTFWKHLTYHLSLKLGQLLQSSHRSRGRQAAGEDLVSHGDQDLARDPSVGGTQLGPGQKGGAQPLGPPFPQHLLTSHQQDHKKSYNTFFSVFPGPKILSQPAKMPRGREQQGPPCIKIWLPNNNIPKAAAYCSLQSRTWHSEKFPYNPFWILTAFNSFSEDLQTVIFSISAFFCDCHRTCLVQQRGVCLVRQKCILNCTWSTSSLFTICLKLKAL